MHECPRAGCGAVFHRPYRLAAHILAHDNKKAYRCQHENCNREYTNNSHLLRHYRSAHKCPEKNAIFVCSKCLKIYSNRQNLKRHLKISHVTGSPYVCDICQKGFSKKYKLTAHMFKHTSVKGFNCEYCSLTFITLHDKKRHLRFHKIYKCDSCNEKFQHWSKYQEHRKQFHTNKEFICHHCGRNFKLRTHIIRHLKIHNTTQNKRVCFMCPIAKCPKFYTTKFNLKQHIESVHGNKTFDCTLCEAKLSTKATLKKHIESHNRTITNTKKKKIQKERKDKGIPRDPLAVKLAGIKLLLKYSKLSVADNASAVSFGSLTKC